MVASDVSEKTIQVELETRIQPNDVEREAFVGGGLKDVQTLQSFIEQQTGFVTVVKGLGQLASAVSELRPPTGVSTPVDEQQVFGVVRMSQMADNKCFVDGSINRLGGAGKRSRNLLLAIHEFGDLSHESFESIGQPHVQIMQWSAELDPEKPISLRQVVPNCDVANMISRSIALSEQFGDQQKRRIISAGVIARASTVGSNKKQVCTCSGKTLWEERLDRRHEDE